MRYKNAIALVPMIAACAGGGGGVDADTTVDAGPPDAASPAAEALVVGDAGELAAVGIGAPWPTHVGPAAIGPIASARFALGRYLLVQPTLDRIAVVDPDSLAIDRSIDVAAGSRPRDIAVIDSDRAYVSAHDRAVLIEIDPSTGATTGGIDLTPVADADGVPDATRMVAFDGRLFVRILRRDRAAGTQGPGGLAVVDLASRALIDADPEAPGVQAIALAGANTTEVDIDMTVVPGTRRLLVPQPGMHLFGGGVVDAVDVDTLVVGTVFAEASIGGQLGPAMALDPGRGVVINHTDISQSSHLHLMDPTAATFEGPSFHDSFEITDEVALDIASGLLFFPERCGGCGGVGLHVFQLADGSRLTAQAVTVGFSPFEVALR